MRTLLLDEPFANLDYVTREQLNDHLVGFSRRLGTTVVIVTHDPQEAVYVADRLAVLRDGQFLEPPNPVNLPEPRSSESRLTPEYLSAVEWIIHVLRASAPSRH